MNWYFFKGHKGGISLPLDETAPWGGFFDDAAEPFLGGVSPPDGSQTRAYRLRR